MRGENLLPIFTFANAKTKTASTRSVDFPPCVVVAKSLKFQYFENRGVIRNDSPSTIGYLKAKLCRCQSNNNKRGDFCICLSNKFH